VPIQRLITFTTDFGLTEHHVGVMKGVIHSINPAAQIIDISNAVQSFDLLDGALAISQAYSYFPKDTVHLVVVDPGVGSSRRPILVSAGQYQFVAPDNGVLSLIYQKEERLSARHVTADHYFLQPVSNTFHARDVFSPIVAYLAKGVDPAKFGEEVTDFVRFSAPKPKAVNESTLRGVVLKVDRFGNLITNITPQDAPMLFTEEPTAFKIVVGKREITEIKSAYALGAPGEVFGILGSMGYLEIAANRGAAAQLMGVSKGTDVNIVLGEAAAAGNGQ